MRSSNSAAKGAGWVVLLALLTSASGQAPAPAPAPGPEPFGSIPPGALTGDPTKLYNATSSDALLRFSGAAFLPFNVTFQKIMIEQAQAAIVEVIGPIAFLDFAEVLPGDGNSSNPLPYVDLYVRVHAFSNPELLRQLQASGQTERVREAQGSIFRTFYAWVFRLATVGVPVVSAPRLLSINPTEGLFAVGDSPLLPLVPVAVKLRLEAQSPGQVSTYAADTILECVRKAVAGRASAAYWLPTEAGMPAALNRTGVANATVRVLAYGCTGRPGNWSCLGDVPLALLGYLAEANLISGIQKAGLGINASVLSAELIPLKQPPAPAPASSGAPTTAAAPAPAPPPGTSPWLPNVSYPNAPVPWHLDRLDSRDWAYDGKFTASNLGSGVNIYLVSSGVQASHNEFQMRGGGPPRVRPVFGYGGLDPLKDCNDSSFWYGFGTYAASLMAGLSVGVAKNATVYSARFREQCNLESPVIWQPGGLPSAMDTVISTAQAPAIMLVDTWWSPSRSVTDDDDYVRGAITARLEAAARANITVIVPGGAADPCQNIFSAHPATIAVGSIDSYDRRSLDTFTDPESAASNGSACIDLWAPGGGLGHGIVGAAPEANDAYVEVATRGDAAAFLVAGIAAQFLSVRRNATPAEVRAFLTSTATPGLVRDVGPRSPNLLAFTDLTENAPIGPPAAARSPAGAVQPQSGAAAGGLSSGAKAGIGSGSGVAVVLVALAAFALWRRRRSRQTLQKAPFWSKATGHPPAAGLIDSADGGGGAGRMGSGPGDLMPGEWDIPEEDVTILKRENGRDWVLGRGSFGTVYKGLKNGVQVVAVKKLQLNEEEYERDRASFIREITTMKYVSRDRNIVQFYGACHRPGNLMLVTELMEGGDLRVALLRDDKKLLNWSDRGKGVALDIARGLHFLHVNKVIHLDLKSKNVLLARDGTAKIGDVGMARVMNNGYFQGGSAVGTFAWAAPELLLGERCTEKVDIYSLGVVLWEIVTREMPIRGALREPLVPEECPREVVDLIEACMHRNPDDRPSAMQAYQRLMAAPPTPYGTADPQLGGVVESWEEEAVSGALHDSAETFSNSGRQHPTRPHRGDGGGGSGRRAATSAGDSGSGGRMEAVDEAGGRGGNSRLRPAEAQSNSSKLRQVIFDVRTKLGKQQPGEHAAGPAVAGI